MQLRDTVLHRCVRMLNADLPAAMLADDSAAEFTSRTLMIFYLSHSHALIIFQLSTVVNYRYRCMTLIVSLYSLLPSLRSLYPRAPAP